MREKPEFEILSTKKVNQILEEKGKANDKKKEKLYPKPPVPKEKQSKIKFSNIVQLLALIVFILYMIYTLLMRYPEIQMWLYKMLN
jgi:hypothetical protein